MLQGLQGLRALGAFSVAISHSWDTPVKASAWYNGSFLVVDMFFMLSGYLVTMAYAERTKTWRDGAGMVVNRLGRLYPTHIFLLFALLFLLNLKIAINLALQAIGVDLGMTPLAQQERFFDLQYFVLSITLLHGVGLGPDLDLFNFAAWSISAEFWAFCTLTLAFVITRGRRGRVVFAGVAIGLCIAFYLWRWWQPAQQRFDFGLLLDRNLARSIMAYFVGMLAYELRRDHLQGLPDAAINALQAVSIAAIVLVVCNQPWLPLSQIWSLPIWAALIISLSYGRGWAVSLLGSSPMVWLGERAFGMYMCHSVVLILIKRRIMAIDGVGPRTLMLIPYLLAVVLIGHLLYRYLEVPAATRVKQWVRERIARPSAVGERERERPASTVS